MPTVFRALFVANATLMTVLVFLAIEGGGTTWSEAIYGIMPCMALSTIFGLLAALLVSHELADDRAKRARSQRTWSLIIGTTSLVYCFTVGGLALTDSDADAERVSEVLASQGLVQVDRSSDFVLSSLASAPEEARMGKLVSGLLLVQAIGPLALIIFGLVAFPSAPPLHHARTSRDAGMWTIPPTCPPAEDPTGSSPSLPSFDDREDTEPEAFHEGRIVPHGFGS